MLSFIFLFCLSLAIAAPVARETSSSLIQQRGVTSATLTSDGSAALTASYTTFRSPVDDEDIVYLVARGKGQKKKNKNKTTIQIAGSGGAPQGYAGSSSRRERSRSPSPGRPPASNSRPHSPSHQPAQHDAHQPHHSSQSRPASPSHPEGANTHPHGAGHPPGNPPTTAPRPPISWANLVRTTSAAQQAGHRAQNRVANPPPFTPTPQTQHAALMRRVNNRRENDGQTPYASGNVAHAFHHNGVIHHLIRNDGRGGLDHINNAHGPQFDAKGWTNRGEIIEKAIRRGRVVANQNPESGNGRPIYEFEHNGGTHHLAVSTAPDGYIVGANVSDPQQVARYQQREREHRARQAAGGSGNGS